MKRLPGICHYTHDIVDAVRTMRKQFPEGGAEHKIMSEAMTHISDLDHRVRIQADALERAFGDRMFGLCLGAVAGIAVGLLIGS